MHITLKQLRAFHAIASTGQVKRAAEQLYLSQPATSMALAELEKQLDCQLFDRSGNRLVLNLMGHRLMSLAAELLDRAEEIPALFNDEGNSYTGNLSIGASTTVGNYLLPERMSQFCYQHPGVNMAVSIQNTATVIEKLAAFELDIGCVEGPCLHPDIEVISWLEDELKIICSPEHPLTRVAFIESGHLAAAQWILREKGSGTRMLFDRYLAPLLGTLNIRMELNHAEAIKQLVKTGAGLSCLPEPCVAPELKRGELAALTLENLCLKRELSILLHKKKYRSRLIEALLMNLRSSRQN